MSETHQSNDRFRLLILARPERQGLKVASLGLQERWEKVSAAFGVPAEVVDEVQLAAALAGAEGNLLVCDGAGVVDQVTLEHLFWGPCAGAEVIALRSDQRGTAPAICLGPTAARGLAEQLPPQRPLEIPQLLAKLEQLPDVTVHQKQVEDSFWSVVQDEADARRAGWGLAKRLQYRPGGLAAIYLNRPISLRISSRLVDTPISANAVTWFGGLVGAAGIVFIFLGGWLNAVIGTGLLHVNNILDGIDGELARLRLKTSEFGAYLDSVLDELLNAALLISVGYHSWQTFGWLPYLFIGIFAGVTGLLYSGAHYHCKWKHGKGLYWWFEAEKPRLAVQRSTSPFAYFKKLFWKESHWLLYLLAALGGVMHIMLLISASGAAVVFAMLFIHVVIMRARW